MPLPTRNRLDRNLSLNEQGMWPMVETLAGPISLHQGFGELGFRGKGYAPHDTKNFNLRIFFQKYSLTKGYWMVLGSPGGSSRV